MYEDFSIRGETYENTLMEDVRVNQGDLSGDFEEHPEKFARWATLYEMALAEEVALKRGLERDYARLDHAVRMEGKSSGIKLTEKMVENTVLTHDNYVESLNKYLEAKRTAGLLKAGRDAMMHRKDMLIQLGATHRAEGISNISILDRETTARGIVGKNR